jgi:ATP-dependent Clp protease protease subunit
VVLHQPATQGRGTVTDLILEADEVARVRLLLEEVLAEHTGRTPEQIRQDTDRTLVLAGSAAVEYGVVDTVLREQGPALA